MLYSKVFRFENLANILSIDWWEGEVHGRKGQFPANYTEIITG